MSDPTVTRIHNDIESKPTDELERICAGENRNQYSEYALIVAQQTLNRRRRGEPSGVRPAVTESRRFYILAGAAIGLFCGYILSYWFQPGVLRMGLSLPNYIGETINMIFGGQTGTKGTQTIVDTILMTVALTSAAGAVAGNTFYNRKATASN